MRVLRSPELDAPAFAPEVLRAFEAAVENNDLVDLAAPPPTSYELDLPDARLVAAFRLSRQLWRERFDQAALRAHIAALRRGEPMDDATARALKRVRAAFKQLRFGYSLFDSGHRSPPLLSLVTLELGELQDAVRVARAGRVRRHAAALRLLLAGPPVRLLRREANRFRPSDAAGLRRFTRAQIGSLRPLLAPRTVGAHDFHAARKVVSRQVSLHDTLRTLAADRAGGERHRAASRWLATLNGLMGQLHDELVARDAAGELRYRSHPVELPGEIRTRLETLVGLHGSASGCDRI